MPRTRAKYDPTVEAKRILEGMTLEQLQSRSYVQEKVIKEKGVKIQPITLGRLRIAMLKEEGPIGQNGSGDLLRCIGVVKKSAKQVGGLEKLEETIKLIKTVREI
jgi:hypothetical protein